jgi:Na+/H+-dicarboxylate symporter
MMRAPKKRAARGASMGCHIMKRMQLHTKIIIGLVLGIGWALLSSYMGWNGFTRDWINPWGDIFIRLLKLIAVPLVLFSIISGVSGLSDVRRLGRTGGKTLLLFLLTTVSAVTLGLVLVNTIQPGSFLPEEDITKNRIRYELWAEDGQIATKDKKRVLRDPEHGALVAEVRAELGVDPEARAARDPGVAKLAATAAQSKAQGPLQPVVDMVPENIVIALGDGKLMLQVIVFALFFGITMLYLPRERTQALIDMCAGINDVFIRMVEAIMRAAPFFVFCLMAGIMAKMANTPQEVLRIFESLGWYALTVVAGLAIMLFLVYPLLLVTLVKDIPYRAFFRRMSPAQFLAFSSSSSAATLPVTMECVEEGLGVPRTITSFVLPIGATVNMDGTSLYQAVAVVFLAQIHGVDLALSQQITIVLTATLASIGAAAVPSAGLVMLMLVLTSVGLNPAWIAIIFPIDRILDMCRTSVNVTSDATVCAIIAKSEGELAFPRDHGALGEK